MGFMDYSITGSDAASDFAYTVADAVVLACKKELKTSRSEYNTPGFVNVALLIESMVFPCTEVFGVHEGMKEIAIKVAAELDKFLAHLQANRTLYDQQQEMIKSGQKIPKNKMVLPLSSSDEFSLRRLGQVYKTVRRYIEDFE